MESRVTNVIFVILLALTAPRQVGGYGVLRSFPTVSLAISAEWFSRAHSVDCKEVPIVNRNSLTKLRSIIKLLRSIMTN